MYNSDYDIYFLISGKALHIAAEYESHIVAISRYVSARQDADIFQMNKADLSAYFAKMLKYISPKIRLEKFELSNDLNQQSIDAVDSRNFIAHEMTLGLEHRQTDVVSIEVFINEIKPDLMKILHADFIMKFIISELNKEPFMHTISWVDETYQWATKY